VLHSHRIELVLTNLFESKLHFFGGFTKTLEIRETWFDSP
jgi:hypothetical protein